MIFSFYALPVCESIAVRNDKVIRSKNLRTKHAHVFAFFCLLCHTCIRAYLTTWQRPGEVGEPEKTYRDKAVCVTGLIEFALGVGGREPEGCIQVKKVGTNLIPAEVSAIGQQSTAWASQRP